jgi:two-component system chemotaxis sensor kinase CheA
MWSAVVVQAGGSIVAVGVDHLRGTHNLVLRPLPKLAPADPIVAGTSLDANGNPQMVLNPQGIVAEARRASPATLVAEHARTAILVIDDSLTTRMLEQSILESAGYDVELAMSGEEGLEKARKRAYALFLVDVEMPGMDGFAFVADIRADPSLRATPAILMTSRDAPDDRQRGDEVGASAYFIKSEFDQNVLLARIRALTERR